MNRETASYCRLRAREHDMDSYLGALFAPEPKRQDLWTLQALQAELARIPALVSEPMLGEIRLQWWREALDGLFAGRALAHPVIEGLSEALTRTSFAREPFERLIDAQATILHPESIESEKALERHLHATGTEPLALAVAVLEPKPDKAVTALIETGGPVLGLARLLRQLPEQAARRRIPLPAELLAKLGQLAAEARMASVATKARFNALRSPRLLPAFLPVSLAEPFLAHAAQPGTDPLAPPREAPLLPRQLRLIGAMMRSRL